jgi:hypothetical protein
MKRLAARYVLCLDACGYPESLAVGKVYHRLADREGARSGLIRVVDETGEDYLSSAKAKVL